MYRRTLKNVAARKLHLLTTSFAALLGVTCMAGTLATSCSPTSTSAPMQLCVNLTGFDTGWLL
jgi:hypothetical protein